MCKCKQERLLQEALVQQAMMKSVKEATYTSLIMEKEALNNPVYVRYNGTGGMRPFTGRTTRNRYFFGVDHKTGWIDGDDATEFLSRQSNGVNIFVVEQEPVEQIVEEPVIESIEIQAEAQVVEEPVEEIVEEPLTEEQVEETIAEIVEEEPVTKSTKRTRKKTS